MKTSNKIFLSFLIFLFGGITLLFIGSKYYKGVNDTSDFKFKETKIAPFSVVVAEPGAFLVLKNGEEYKVSQRYKKDVVPDFAPFEVRNDTLFIAASKSKISDKWFFVPEVYGKNVKHITAKEDSNVNINDYQVDSLFIRSTKALVDWKYDKAVFVAIDAKNSSINFNGNHIEEINAQFDNTQLYISSPYGVKKVTGSLINNSEFQGGLNGKVEVSVDQSSRLYMRN